MTKVWMWFFLSCKRYGKRLSFLLILLFLPIGAMAARHFQEKGDAGISIASAPGGRTSWPSSWLPAL